MKIAWEAFGKKKIVGWAMPTKRREDSESRMRGAIGGQCPPTLRLTRLAIANRRRRR